MTEMSKTAEGDAFLLFGATGDLARKKLWPALYELTTEGRLDMPIIGIARSEWTREQMCERARESVIEQLGEKAEVAVIKQLCERIQYVAGAYEDAATWTKLAELADGAQFRPQSNWAFQLRR